MKNYKNNYLYVKIYKIYLKLVKKVNKKIRNLEKS